MFYRKPSDLVHSQSSIDVAWGFESSAIATCNCQSHAMIGAIATCNCQSHVGCKSWLGFFLF